MIASNKACGCMHARVPNLTELVEQFDLVFGLQPKVGENEHQTIGLSIAPSNSNQSGFTEENLVVRLCIGCCGKQIYH